MDPVAKKLLNILIQLAESDKHFAKAEYETINRIAKEKNFTEDDITALKNSPEPIASLSTLTPDQKFEFLYSSIEIIFSDHNILDTEIMFVKNIAIRLGFKKDIVDYLIENYGKKSRDEVKTVTLGRLT